MTPQIPQRISHQPQPRPFFECRDSTEIFVVLAEALDDTILTDPETNETIPSLRQSYSANGLCFAHEVTPCAPGIYWAAVGAVPNSTDAEPMILMEEYLDSALPWNADLEGKSPDFIRHMLLGSAQEAYPTQPSSKCSKPDDLLPTPSVPLERTITIGLSSDEIEGAFKFVAQHTSLEPSISKPASDLDLQQGLIRAVLNALQQRLAHVWHQPKGWSIQARCTLMKRLQRWHQQTHQRVINVTRGWCEKRRSVVWFLTVGVPESLLATPLTTEVLA